MKGLILFFSFIALGSSTFAQEFKGLNDLPMKTNEDFKMAEPTVKECAGYILSHPSSNDDRSAANAGIFMLKWMSGSPDYSFNLDMDATKYAKKDNGLLMVCMASMAKTALDNPAKAKDTKALKLSSFKLFAEYCANAKYKVKQSSEIKKLIKANESGTLEKCLDFSALDEQKK
jgi:hypothetical protein